jgi:hypothetical protein
MVVTELLVGVAIPAELAFHGVTITRAVIQGMSCPQSVRLDPLYILRYTGIKIRILITE